MAHSRVFNPRLLRAPPSKAPCSGFKVWGVGYVTVWPKSVERYATTFVFISRVRHERSLGDFLNRKLYRSVHFSIREQLLHINVQRFRGRLVSKAYRLCVSLNSRLESNKKETHQLPAEKVDAACWLVRKSVRSMGYRS